VERSTDTSTRHVTAQPVAGPRESAGSPGRLSDRRAEQPRAVAEHKAPMPNAASQGMQQKAAHEPAHDRAKGNDKGNDNKGNDNKGNDKGKGKDKIEMQH